MEEEDFKTRLKSAKNEFLKNTNKNNNSRGHFMGSAFRLGTELVASVVVGTIIGFILDSWFDTKPWFCLLYTSPSPRDLSTSRMPSSA